MKLKNSNGYKPQKSNCDKTQKLEMSHTKKSNGDKTLKNKLCQNSNCDITQIVIKLKISHNSHSDQTKNSNCEKTKNNSICDKTKENSNSDKTSIMTYLNL